MDKLSLCSRHQRENWTPKGLLVVSYPTGCSTCHRINIERDVVLMTVSALLSAGYAVGTDQAGEQDPAEHACMGLIAPIKAELMDVDSERVYVFPVSDDGKIGDAIGWVYFVYGNDGYDVISDYTTNLEDVLKPVNDYTDAIS